MGGDRITYPAICHGSLIRIIRKGVQFMYDADKRKLLSLLSHGAIFFSTTLVSIGIPLAILFVSDDPVVKDNAKESINFHLNVWAWGAVIVALSFLTFGLLGFILAPAGYVLHWGLTAFALLKVFGNPDRPFEYPFIFRVL
jgi:FtsH-binding integral membrane protein